MLQELLELMRRAKITENGTIILGDHVSVDGPTSRLVRVVTHIHNDHLIGLEESIKNSLFIVATPITHDLLAAMGYRIPPSKMLKLEYNKTIKIEDDELVLISANHIPGAAQVKVVTGDGLLLAYTSDFKLPGTPIIRDADVLVIDATYGIEDWQRPWQEEIDRLLVDIVMDSLTKGPVHIYGYHGKLQEVMLLLRREGVDTPFIAPRKIYNMAIVLKRYGYNIGDLRLEGSREAQEAIRDGWYIYFQHINSRPRSPLGGIAVPVKPINIILTGWEFKEPFRRVNDTTWLVSYSDHADFKQLVKYVEEAKPKLLITDKFRGGKAAEYFATYVRRKLGIPAIALP